LTLNKKALFAAMVAAALPAAASAQVKMYGTVDAYLSNTSSGGTSTTALGSGGMTTSYWGIGGSEDLGGGTKAFFALESFFNVNNGTSFNGTTSSYSNGAFSDPFSASNQTLFARNAFVGLESSTLGSVTAGRIVSPFFLNSIIFNPFADSFGFSPMVYHTWGGSGSLLGGEPVGAISGIWTDTANNNTIRYKSPMMGGLQIEGDYSFSNKSSSDPASKDLQTTELTAFYFGGDLSGAASYRSVTFGPDSAGLKQTAYLLSGAYDLKVAKLFGQYMQNKLSASGPVGSTAKTYQLGVSVPAGPGKVLASVASTEFSAEGWDLVAAGAGDKRQTWALGYDYALSKRTDIYAAYNDDKWTNSNNAETKKFGVGIRHNF
jgi:predicted porin